MSNVKKWNKIKSGTIEKEWTKIKENVYSSMHVCFAANSGKGIGPKIEWKDDNIMKDQVELVRNSDEISMKSFWLQCPRIWLEQSKFKVFYSF